MNHFCLVSRENKMLRWGIWTSVIIPHCSFIFRLNLTRQFMTEYLPELWQELGPIESPAGLTFTIFFQFSCHWYFWNLTFFLFSTATSTQVKTQLEQDVFNLRRTLRSSANLQSKASTSTSTSTTTHETLPSYKVDSDSDGEDLMTSFLDKVMPSSVNNSAKKTHRSVKNDSTSNGVFAEACKLKPQAPEEPSVTTQTAKLSNMGVLDDDKSSNYSFDKPFNKKTARGDVGIAEVLFGVDVVLDSKKSEVQPNVLNSSDKVLDKGNAEINKSKANANELEGENSVCEGEGLSEANTNTDENRSDFIQPPKRRSIVQVLDDDLTDDEGNLSQPVFSLHVPTKEASADREMPSSKEESNNEFSMPTGEQNDEAISDDVVSLDSPSLMTQSVSQGILGKSILETMATDGETLLPSQALSEAGSVSHELFTEIIEDSSNTRSSSSVVRPTAKRGTERFTGGEQLTIDVDSDDGRHVRRTRSDAAGKAATAAIGRQFGTSKEQELREAWSSRYRFFLLPEVWHAHFFIIIFFLCMDLLCISIGV